MCKHKYHLTKQDIIFLKVNKIAPYQCLECEKQKLRIRLEEDRKKGSSEG